MSQHHDIVETLKSIIFTNDWTNEFQEAINDAKQKGVTSLDEYFDWLDNLVEWIPYDPGPQRTLYNEICQFYWFLDQSSVKDLQNNADLSNWMIEFAKDWGKFLDTTESAKHIDSFIKRAKFHMDDYAPNPSGWLTFNQFFARSIKPGRRPIEGLCDDGIIVSPADCTPAFSSVISHNTITTAKGMSFSILDLLKNSPYQKEFDGGIFMHSFLDVNDYHRFHTPVAGKILEVRDIPGQVYMDVKKEGEDLSAQDGTGYQFTQARGLIVIESNIGKVAVLPIGMAQVSSVILDVDKDAVLHKGQEFGHFLFGGSDIIVLFSKKCNVEITVPVDKNQHCNQGTKIANVKK